MTVTIKQALDVAAGELSQSDSPRLDAELLLAHILSVERSHLYAHPDVSSVVTSVSGLTSSVDALNQNRLPICWVRKVSGI